MRKLLIVFFIFSSLIISQPKREFRGAWVATVANIDWPSKNNLSTDEQIREMYLMFKKLKDAGLNAVLFQVRTECDALYKSELEPWSFHLTGMQGKAPEPFYDPLEKAIQIAHEMNMELHAWFNPYRAVRIDGEYELAENHVAKLHPEWILQFEKLKILNPGIPEVREFILNIIKDVLNRYDIDGIHFDDYFYPYTPKISIEDSSTFANYNRGFTNIDDWRRNNINILMKEIYSLIKSTKPYVKFGISPFGIVKNEYAGTNGFQSYDILYCDPLSWIEGKYIDYINPQLYWEMNHKTAPYSKLLPWWASIKNERHLYIGHFSSRTEAKDYKGDKSELDNQIKMNRRTENVDGSIFFSAKSISGNWNNLADRLKENYYSSVAFPPTMPWIDSIPPLPPTNLTISQTEKFVTVNWDSPHYAEDGELPTYYAVYRFNSNETIDINDAGKIIYLTYPGETIFLDYIANMKKGSYFYVVTSLDRMRNESISISAGPVDIK
ncbi:MAG: glycoside hydrolase family 10 protein [Ignavibacteriales bacterium]